MSNNKLSLGCGHLGNGLLIWNRAIEEHGDYQRIAHISPEREVTWYVKRPCQATKVYVQSLVDGPNMSVSTSQPYQLVFKKEA